MKMFHGKFVVMLFFLIYPNEIPWSIESFPLRASYLYEKMCVFIWKNTGLHGTQRGGLPCEQMKAEELS